MASPHLSPPFSDAGWPAPPRICTHEPGNPVRAQVEDFIGRVYRDRHGAHVRHFSPTRVSLHNTQGEIVAAAGYRAASHEQLCLERYMDSPLQTRLTKAGGAAVVSAPVQAAHSLGMPAYEGYGLSEGTSAQTPNLPGASKVGSVGRPLANALIRCAADGELEVSGRLFNGYLGDTTPPPAWWPTGDLGSIDADGFVHVSGRNKHVLITAFGRNVSPEWVETSLSSQPGILQAVVFGDGEPSLSAVLWPINPHTSDAALQVARWTRALAAFDQATGLATANGRPQRPAIWALHAELLSTLATTTTP